MSDNYSKFPFVYVIPSPVISTAVIGKMKSLFAEPGVPQRVISVNGGHFSSDAFRMFADQWCFDHVTSSPYYPQSNGFIERHVETVKHTLKKVGPRSDVQMAVLVLRATPIDSHLPSPAELLYGRSVVSNLPVATWNASGKRSEIRARLVQRQATAKERHGAPETWQNFHLANTSVPVTRALTDGNPVVLSSNANNHTPTMYNRPAEAYCGGTGVTSVRHLRDTFLSVQYRR